jgi:hypothetical protein
LRAIGASQEGHEADALLDEAVDVAPLRGRGDNSIGFGESALATAASKDDKSGVRSFSDGTWTIPPQPLHLARLPAVVSATLKCFPQVAQSNSMLIYLSQRQISAVISPDKCDFNSPLDVAFVKAQLHI